MAEGKKEVWSDWIELEGTNLHCSIPAEIRGYWDSHNVQYLMKDHSVVDGQLYPDEVPCSYTDDEGYVIEDYTMEWAFVDDNTDPVYSVDVKAWRYQKE
jgi:hypothetical protein